MSKLSLIITHHNEEANIIKPLFQSLNLQVGINWDDIEIILCNNTGRYFDYTDVFRDLNNIKDKIIYLNTILPNPGLNRQQGIDHSTSEYYTVLECDDRLFSCFTLHIMLEAINNNPGVDIINYKVVNDSSLEPYPLLYGIVGCGTYGSIVRTQFLIDNDIRNIDIPMDDDTFLTKVARAISDKKVVSLNDILYIWCPRQNSTSKPVLDRIGNEKWYKVRVDCSLTVIEKLYEYCQTHKQAQFDTYRDAWLELPYFYWKFQEYENRVGKENVNIDLVEQENQKIVEVYSKFNIDYIYNLTHSHNFINISECGDDTTFEQWLTYLFKLN